MPDILKLPRVIIDFETRSWLDVRKVGAWKYAEHASTEILCLGYKLPGKKRKLWWPWEPFPQELVDAVEAGWVFEAHNTQFEMAIWSRILHRLMSIPMPKWWVDTMASCAYRALPLGLDKVGEVLGLSIQKDKRGKYLLNQLSKPRKPKKAEREAFAYMGLEEQEWPVLWRKDPDLMRELGEYCLTDVDSEEDLGETIGDLPLSEFFLWWLDQRINIRGLQVDLEAVHKAIEILEILESRYTAELREVTGGALESANQRDKFKDWLHEQCVAVPDMQADTLKKVMQDLNDQITNGDMCFEEVAHVWRALELRDKLKSTSTKKLYMFQDCTCDDGRVRGLLQYHGASTGRWSGRLIQPQNLPRGSLEDYAEALRVDPDTAMEILIDCIKLGGQDGIDALEMTFGDPMEAIITALRGMFIVPEGRVMRVADFSAIEAVVLAWVAGEEWKVDAFHTINIKGEKYKGMDDMYCATASKILTAREGKEIIVRKKTHKKERQQFGKVPELAFGYEGGVGAWYNFDPNPTLTDEEIDTIKTAWRRAHPAIAGEYNEFTAEDGRLVGYFKGGLWKGLNEAAVQAVLNPGRRFSYRMIGFETVKDDAGFWLTAILPNGRRLWYYNPEVEEHTSKYGKKYHQLSYEGRDNKRGGVWGRVYTYGGMLAENIVQAIARDLLAEAMVRVEKEGFAIILTVHDEILAEDDDYGDKDAERQALFVKLMSVVSKWAKGCPVGVGASVMKRYRKDG